MRGVVENKARKEEEETFFCVSVFSKRSRCFLLPHIRVNCYHLYKKTALQVQDRKEEREGGWKKWRARRAGVPFFCNC